MYSLSALFQLLVGVLIWAALAGALPLCIERRDRPDYWRLMFIFHVSVMFAVIWETA